MTAATQADDKKPMCGIVMPISSIDGCDESHWQEVLSIIQESITKTQFESNLVSSADDVGIIQKRIVQNLYQNPIVVCDISAKNPNVMFELGLRLAFDKATIIIKDDKTSYPFDTSPIEHLSYPRDLRFSKIVEFKDMLSQKIIATDKASKSDPNYTTFLKHFGTFTVAKIDSKEVTSNEFLIEEFRELKREMRISREVSDRHKRARTPFDDNIKFMEFARRAKRDIRAIVREMGLKGFESINQHKERILDVVEEKSEARMYFDARQEYVFAFNLIFSLMYDN